MIKYKIANMYYNEVLRCQHCLVHQAGIHGAVLFPLKIGGTVIRSVQPTNLNPVTQHEFMGTP